MLFRSKILNKYQNQISNLSEERFNIFRICGVNHYEVTHSSIITELLSNNSSHNFGTKFLDAFIQTLIKDKIIDNDYFFSLQDIKVIPEYSVGEFGRIDILITNINQCIIIENKIYANDQQNQLKRYETFAKQNFKNHLLLYLTLYGDEASEFSAKDSDYKLISYGQTMINWLERCVEIAAKNPVIRETLIQYINHLKYLTNNKIKTLNDLKGKKVGTSVGSNYNKILTDFDKNKEINLVYYDGNVTEIFQEISLGRLDATVNDRLTVGENIKKLGLKVKVVGNPINKVPSYFVFRKDSGDLKNKVDKALLSMKKDGTLAKISKKWFNQDFTK